jgi:hypothetical protein
VRQQKVGELEIQEKMKTVSVGFSAAVLLSGCGLATGLIAQLDSTPDFVDISSSGSTATIKGATRNALITHVVCQIEKPARTRKLKIDAGRIEIGASCTVVGEYREYTSFEFDAIADHEYRIRMHVPGNGNISLIDDTTNDVIDVHAQIR